MPSSVLILVPVSKPISHPPSTAFQQERLGATSCLQALVAPQLHSATRSNPRSALHRQAAEDRGTAPPLLRAQTQLLVCSGGTNFARHQGGMILSDSGCKQVTVWPLRLLSPQVRIQVSPPPPPGCQPLEDMGAEPEPLLSSPKTFHGFSEMGVRNIPPRAHQLCCFKEGPCCSALCTHSSTLHSTLQSPRVRLSAAVPILRPARAVCPCSPTPGSGLGLGWVLQDPLCLFNLVLSVKCCSV